MRQYVNFIKPQNFGTADIKCLRYVTDVLIRIVLSGSSYFFQAFAVGCPLTFPMDLMEGQSRSQVVVAWSFFTSYKSLF